MMASFFFALIQPNPNPSKCCGLYLPPGMRIACQHFISLFVTACLVDIGYGWTHHRASFTGPKTGATLTSRRRSSCRPSTTSLGPTSLEQQPEAPTEDDGQRVLAVVAPLKYTGQSNYPTLNLQFPELDQVMDDGSVQGVSLDFVMDTGANVNTVEGMVVDSYSLQPCPPLCLHWRALRAWLLTRTVCRWRFRHRSWGRQVPLEWADRSLRVTFTPWAHASWEGCLLGLTLISCMV